LLAVDWEKDTAGWRPLNLIELSEIETVGAYIIWPVSNPSRVVCVGSGVVAERISFHQFDPETQAYGSLGRLYVTWAALSRSDLLGVERYLQDQCKPLISAARSQADPISVNLPFDAFSVHGGKARPVAAETRRLACKIRIGTADALVKSAKIEG